MVISVEIDGGGYMKDTKLYDDCPNKISLDQRFVILFTVILDISVADISRI